MKVQYNVETVDILNTIALNSLYNIEFLVETLIISFDGYNVQFCFILMNL